MSEQGVGRVDDSLCRFTFDIFAANVFVKQMDKRRISSRSYQIRSSSSNVADLIFSLHSVLLVRWIQPRRRRKRTRTARKRTM